MERYERPRLVATYSIAELRAEAAISLTYISDRTLKQKIETIEHPLAPLGRIRTPTSA